MSSFRVWIRSLGHSSRVRVEGLDNAEWLVRRLSQSFVFKSSEPMNEELDNSCFSFHVIHGSNVTRFSLERLLATIPELNVNLEPA